MPVKFYKVLFLIALILIFVRPAFAQNVSQKGITVFPSIAHLDLATDPAEYDLTYINNTDYFLQLQLKVQDFSELEDSYKINFLTGKDATNYKYSLSSWVSFENSTLNLNPKEKKTIKVFIDKNRITKGGHYASILAQVQSPDNPKAVGVKAILSSLLFVRASTGQEVEDASIQAFRPNRENLSFPDSFIVRLENSGNVFITPYGLLQIFDSRGNLVAKGILNQDSLDSLPESIRNYKIPIKSLDGQFIAPGKYTAKIDVTYGKGNKKLSAQTTFLTTGSLDIVQMTVVLVLILGALLFLKRKVKN